MGKGKSNSKNIIKNKPTKKPILKSKEKTFYISLEDKMAISNAVAKKGKKAITFIRQKDGVDLDNDYGVFETYSSICQSYLLKDSPKSLVLTQNACDKLYKAFLKGQENEQAFYLLGYNKDNFIMLEDVKIPYVRDRSSDYTTIPFRKVLFYYLESKIKYRDKGKPFLFLGHTHPHSLNNNYQENKCFNNFSMIDLLMTETVDLYAKESLFSSLFKTRDEELNFGTMMINQIGDINTAWANENQELECFKHIYFTDKNNKIKDIGEYEINGVKPFGVYRNIKDNYSIVNKANKDNFIEMIVNGKGEYCDDALLDEGGMIFKI